MSFGRTTIIGIRFNRPIVGKGNEQMKKNEPKQVKQAAKDFLKSMKRAKQKKTEFFKKEPNTQDFVNVLCGEISEKISEYNNNTENGFKLLMSVGLSCIEATMDYLTKTYNITRNQLIDELADVLKGN